MASHRPPVDRNAVTIDVAEDAKIGRAEGLQPIGRGFRDFARRMDFVVERHQYAQAARGRLDRDAHRAEEVHAGITAERAGWPLRPDQDDSLLGLENEIEEIS